MIGTSGFLSEFFLVIFVSIILLGLIYEVIYEVISRVRKRKKDKGKNENNKNHDKVENMIIYLILGMIITSNIFTAVLTSYINQVKTHSFFESLKIEEIDYIMIGEKKIIKKDLKKIFVSLKNNKWFSRMTGDITIGFDNSFSFIIFLKTGKKKEFKMMYSIKEKKAILLIDAPIIKAIYFPKFYNILDKIGIKLLQNNKKK